MPGRGVGFPVGAAGVGLRVRVPSGREVSGRYGSGPVRHNNHAGLSTASNTEVATDQPFSGHKVKSQSYDVPNCQLSRSGLSQNHHSLDL